MTKHVSNFISKLVVHFGEPKYDVAEADKGWAHREWLREMVANLGHFDAEVLDKAASTIAATRKHRNFPLISECSAACYDARRKLAEEKPKLKIEAPKGENSYTAERKALAKSLVSGEMGRQAAREGWIWSLYVYCLRHAALPVDQKKISSMKEAAGKVQPDVEDLMRKGDTMSKTLANIGSEILRRRDTLADYVLHGVDA